MPRDRKQPHGGEKEGRPAMGLMAWVKRHPRLSRAGRTGRMVAMTGPWHPLLLAFSRRFARNPRIAPSPRSLLPELDPSSTVARLERDGWADGIRLPAETVGRIVEFVDHSPRREYDDPHLHCAAVGELARDPKVLEVVRRYLGTEPILRRCLIWRNDAVREPEHVHRFHFDVVDVKSLALFVHLSDVDPQSGPHMVIPGTHRPKPLRDTLRLYLDDRAAEARYPDGIRMILGGPGTAFFEEQTAYHKQLTPQKSRMMLQILYTIWPVPRRHRRLPASGVRPS